MKYIALCLCLLAGCQPVVAATVDWDVSGKSRQRHAIEWYQADTVPLVYALTDDDAPLDLTTWSQVVWQVVSATNLNQRWVSSTGTVSATNQVYFELAPEESNLQPGRYVGFVRGIAGDPIESQRLLVSQGIVVNYAPDGSEIPLSGPLSYYVADAITSNAAAIVANASAIQGILDDLDDYLTAATAAATYQPLGDYATAGELAAAVAPLATTQQLAAVAAAIPSLDGYATTTDLAAAVAPLATTQQLAAATSPLASTSELAAAVAPLATTQQLAAAVAPLATTQQLAAAIAPLATTQQLAAVAADLSTHATDTDNPHAVTAEQIGALTAETDAIALAAVAGVESNLSALATNKLNSNADVICGGGPLYPDFATTKFGRVGSYTNGWEDATGDVVTTGAVVATVMHRSLVDRFIVTASNVRPVGAEVVIEAGTNMQDGDFQYSPFQYAPLNSSAGLVTNGPHWIPGTAAGSTGTVTVTVGDFTATIERTKPEIYGYTNYLAFVSFVPGSLHADTFSAMYALASAPGASTNVFTSTDPWTRNPAVWTGDIDLTCVSASNSWSEHYGAGVAITPQHFAMSQHWPGTTAIGHTFTWIDNDNVAHTRTVTNVRTNTGHRDAAIALLDSPLPSSITPASLFDVAQFDKLKAPWCAVNTTNGPTNHGLAYIGPTSGLFGMKFSRNRRVSPSFMAFADAASDSIVMAPDTTMPLFSRVLAGDSGQPSLAFVEGKTVLVTTFHSYNVGPQYATGVPAFEAAMADMGGSIYGTVTLVDLSAWPDY